MQAGSWVVGAWSVIAPHLITKDLVTAEVPGLLSGMGVVNTVAAFAYTTALARVAAIKYRRRAIGAFVFAWVAIVLVVLDYVLNSLFGWRSAILVDAGLLVWIVSFALALFFVYLGSRTVVGVGVRNYERGRPFHDQSGTARFGVPFIDQVLRHGVRARGHVTYPFLLLHDINSPGLQFAAMYARAGLCANEAVIYLTFSRPHHIVDRLILRDKPRPPGLWVVDCYSKVYLPEEVRTGALGTTLHADPRDPADVYKNYMIALAACRRWSDSVRVVYETLSDFIKIADTDLVMNYLRRVVVLEEMWHVRAVYLFWQGAVGGQVDAAYLRWFFSTTLDTVMPHPMRQPALLQTTFNRVFEDPVTVRVGRDLRLDEAGLFQVSWSRAERLGEAMRRLHFAARPYGFLAGFHGADRSWHLANFLFFMAAIDHDTHRPNLKFEDTLDGRNLHGSDLLYALAERAKADHPDLFLPTSFAAIDDDAVAVLFTTPSGLTPADIPGRAALFRSGARTLIDLYGGDVRILLQRTHRLLEGSGGLMSRLAAFEAFRDPIGKKAALLAKLLVREGMFQPLDGDRMDVAIDHVVMTMALRAGVVRTSAPDVREAVCSGTALDQLQIDILREVTREAMRALVTCSGLRPDEVDDLIWSYGRISLRQETPLEDPAGVHTDLDPQLEQAALPDFVSILNGRDAGPGEGLPGARTICGPFTRFF